jgi:oligopeptidase B
MSHFSAPRAKTSVIKTRIHNRTLADPYAWLRDRQNPETIAYLEAENRHTADVMKSTEGLQSQLYREIVGRIRQSDTSVATRRGPYLYYTRTEKDRQYEIHCRRFKSMRAPEEILLDENELAAGEKYFRIGDFAISPNQDLIAYSVDSAGDEAYTIFVKDLNTGKLLAERIPNTFYTLEWANDNRTFFYTVLDKAKRPYKLLRHAIGKPHTIDVVVHHERDQCFELEIHKTRDHKFLLLEIQSHATSEVRILDAEAPEDRFRVLLPRRQAIEYSADHHKGWFYIRINDAGRNYRLVKSPVAGGPLEEVVAHRPAVMIESVEAFRDHIVLIERENGLSHVCVRDVKTGASHRAEMPEPVFSLPPAENAEFDTDWYRFGYTSLVTPLSHFDYNMKTRRRVLKKQSTVRGGYDASQYKTERLFATASDGARVPISIVYRKPLRRNGKSPLLLYGYGAYGIPMDPEFHSDRLSLLDRGFAFAIAHVRGGEDLGKAWHDAGRLLNKKNSFTDFIACAEHLVANGYTSPSRLMIEGGSAGGLLMGAVLNMRPELFAAAVAKVPFVDVVNSMLDESLPLTVAEYEEWGNPREKKFFDYIRAYAPYENVGPKRYPHLLVTAGLNDPRVQYWEPAKWVAKLRAAKTDHNVLLLKTNMGAGHFGKSGRYEKWKEIALEYAFLLTTAAGEWKHGYPASHGKRHAIAREGGVDIDSLSLLQRVLLISDGTLTDAIEAAYLEPIHLVKLGIQSAPAVAGVEALDLKAGEWMMQRDILLRGATSGNNYVYARTLIALDKLDAGLRRDLLESDNPIGRLWVQYKLETRKEILKIWRLPARRLGRYFGHAASAGLLARTYRVISGGVPVMVISEYFPLEPGAEVGKGVD